MFVVLDTNHYRELLQEAALGRNLENRLVSAEADAFTTVITVQEVTQGWSAEINRRKTGRDQVNAYRQFQKAVDDFAAITILAFDEQAAEVFHQLQALRLNVGTMDLKIAAICVSHNALLLTRNLVDFTGVPGLLVENWLD